MMTEKSYLPGNGPFKVGDHIKYNGEPHRFHPDTPVVENGDTGTVVHDFGWDYRYQIKLDKDGSVIRPPMSYTIWELDNTCPCGLPCMDCLAG